MTPDPRRCESIRSPNPYSHRADSRRDAGDYEARRLARARQINPALETLDPPARRGRKPGTPVTDTLKRRIIEAARLGVHTAGEVAHLLGLSRESVTKAAREAGFAFSASVRIRHRDAAPGGREAP